jgi:MYXO-CTERM domain-containing protein
MQVDPIFAENVDLEGVSNRYQATYRDRGCFTGSGQLIFSDGSRMMVVDGQQGGVVERQAGETVRGVETNAAALIERTLSAGQPEVIERDRPDTSMPTNPPVPVPDREDDPAFNGGDEGGCDGCSTYDEEPPVVPLIALGVLGLLRRRR